MLAPNASHMTLDGTNTYVLTLPGSGAAIVVDPGPDDLEHAGRVDAVLASLDAACALVLVTHHHHDHAEAALSWGRRFGCQVAAPTREVAGPDGQVVGDREVLRVGGLVVDVVATPGHCHDHTAYRLPNGTLLSGDHVLGRGTSVVAWPEGDLVAYLDSLRMVLDLGPDALYPGHGPELTEDPMAVVQFYLDHRAHREAQILAALAEEPSDPAGIVRTVYAEVDHRLWPAAEMSTRAALRKLVAEGRVRTERDGEAYRLT